MFEKSVWDLILPAIAIMATVYGLVEMFHGQWEFIFLVLPCGFIIGWFGSKIHDLYL